MRITVQTIVEMDVAFDETSEEFVKIFQNNKMMNNCSSYSSFAEYVAFQIAMNGHDTNIKGVGKPQIDGKQPEIYHIDTSDHVEAFKKYDHLVNVKNINYFNLKTTIINENIT